MRKRPWRAELRSLAYEWLLIDRAGISAEDALAVEAYRDNREIRQFKVLMWIGVLYHVTIGSVAVTVARPRGVMLLLICHLTSLASIIVWFLVAPHRRAVKDALATLANMVLIGVYAHLLHLSLQEPDPFSEYTIKGWVMLLNLAFFLSVFAPSRRMMLPTTLIGIGWIHYAWSGIAGGFVISGGMVFALGFALLFRLAQERRTWHQGRLELKVRHLARQAEQERIDRDLAMAREIHASMAPEPRIEARGVTIDLLAPETSAFSGTWLAHRRLADDGHALLLCDVVGEGIGAALILHAVQSLWAEGLARSDLDAPAWLARADRCLREMSVTERHAAAIGLVIVEAERLTYWSAGQRPLHVVTHGTSPGTGRLGGGGRPLGDDLGLAVVTAEVARSETPIEVLFASTGVLAAVGAAGEAAQVVDLLRRLDVHGAGALEGASTERGQAVARVTMTRAAPVAVLTAA